jgi:hypothetical protein
MLNASQKKLLGSQGYFRGEYGNKVGWENIKGYEVDPVMRILSKTHEKMDSSEDKRLTGLWEHRINEAVDMKLAKKFLRTDKYIESEKRRLKIK